jgi:hypothetical protein
MYEVSGQDLITSHSFDRYIKDKERYDDQIKNLSATDSGGINDSKKEEVFSATTESGTPAPDPLIELGETIRRAPKEKVASMIAEGLDSPDINVQKTSASMIWRASEDDEALLRKVVVQKVTEGLASPDPEIQKKATKMIIYAEEGARASLITQGLNSPNVEVQKASVDMISYNPERDNLVALAVEKNLGNYLIEPSLYSRGMDVAEDKFSRATFTKTGSETVLLGGELKGKTILRKVSPSAFMSWQRLYEDYNLWQEAGFDYVPIEPIQSFGVNEDKFVDVYCSVLDLNLGQWCQKAIMFTDDLNVQMEKIIQVVKDNNVVHGHPKAENFCLRFFRDEKGQPDFTRTPRLYLIDFDRAQVM